MNFYCLVMRWHRDRQEIDNWGTPRHRCVECGHISYGRGQIGRAPFYSAPDPRSLNNLPFFWTLAIAVTTGLCMHYWLVAFGVLQ